MRLPKSIVTVFVKEMREVFRDKRAITLTVAIPLLLIPMMSLLGAWIGMQVEPQQAKGELQVMVHADQPGLNLQTILNQDDKTSGAGKVHFTWRADAALVEQAVARGEADAGLLFTQRLRQPAAVDVQMLYPRLSAPEDKAVLKNHLAAVEQQLLDSGLAVGQYDADQAAFLRAPLSITETAVTVTNDARQLFGASLGSFALMLLLIYSLTGASVYAFDLTVGEKDRGTLEALLMVPQERLALVVGKLLTVLGIGCATALSGLLGIAVMLVVSTLFGGEVVQENEVMVTAFLAFVNSVNMVDVLMVAVYYLPVLVILGALLMIIGIYARSEHEAKVFLMPLMALVIVPTIAVQGQVDQLPAGFMLIPFINDVFGLRGYFSGHSGALWLGITSGVNFLAAAAAVVLCCALFRKESVLMRA